MESIFDGGIEYLDKCPIQFLGECAQEWSNGRPTEHVDTYSDEYLGDRTEDIVGGHEGINLGVNDLCKLSGTGYLGNGIVKKRTDEVNIILLNKQKTLVVLWIKIAMMMGMKVL